MSEMFQHHCVLLFDSFLCLSGLVMSNHSVVVVLDFTVDLCCKCVFYICNKCIGMCQLFFFGFYMWGRVPGWQLVSGVGVLNCGDTPGHRI